MNVKLVPIFNTNWYNLIIVNLLRSDVRCHISKFTMKSSVIFLTIQRILCDYRKILTYTSEYPNFCLFFYLFKNVLSS